MNRVSNLLTLSTAGSRPVALFIVRLKACHHFICRVAKVSSGRARERERRPHYEGQPLVFVVARMTSTLAHFWEFRRPHCGHAKINIASCPLIMLCVLCPGLFIYISGSNPTTGFLGFSLPITLLVWLVPFVVLRGQLRPLARNTIIVGMDCPICLESFKDTAFSLVCGTQHIRFWGEADNNDLLWYGRTYLAWGMPGRFEGWTERQIRRLSNVQKQNTIR